MLIKLRSTLTRHHQKTEGLTLIELLIVIALVAIVAGIALPIILNILFNAKSTANADSNAQIADFINQWSNAGYTVTYIDPSDPTYGHQYGNGLVAYDDNNGNGQPDSGEPIIAHINGGNPSDDTAPGGDPNGTVGLGDTGGSGSSGSGGSGSTSYTTVTWTKTTAPYGNWASISASSNFNTLIATTEDGYIYHSNNGGATWIASVGLYGGGWSVAVSGNGNIVFATGGAYVEAPDGNYVWSENFISTNGGFSFNPLPIWDTSEAGYTETSEVSASYPMISYNGEDLAVQVSSYGQATREYTSRDGGIDWTWVITGGWRQTEVPMGMSSDGNKILIYGGGDTGYGPGFSWESDDAGVDWHVITTDPANLTFFQMSADGETIYAHSIYDSILSSTYYKSTDGGATWNTYSVGGAYTGTPQSSGNASDALAYEGYVDNNLHVVVQNGDGTDGTWSVATPVGSDAPATGYIEPFAVNYTGNKIVVADDDSSSDGYIWIGTLN